LSLQSTIEALAAAGSGADRAKARAAFDELKAALEQGTVRSAEPDSSAPTGWRVNTWVKQGILLGFRFGDFAAIRGLERMGGPSSSESGGVGHPQLRSRYQGSLFRADPV
jgi:hypothetical protein